MVVYNTLTVENQSLIVEKAKTKADGVYSFRGIVYRVRDNRVTHFACGGEILQPYGHFNAVVGSYDKFASKVLKAIN